MKGQCVRRWRARVFALERNSKVFLAVDCVLIRALLSKARSERLPTFSFISRRLVLGQLSGSHATTTDCNLWLCLMSHSHFLFMLHIKSFLSLSLHLIPLSLLLYVLKFSRSSPFASPPSLPNGFSLLQSSSLDSPWITWEKQLFCLLLLSIIASATPTTGFICWRRVTFDTSASQAGLPLSPFHALFLVAEGADRAFNEIQTLGMRSHRHLRTSLPLTSVAVCGDQKTLSQAA